ncbi:hypothetical protein ABG067_002082 [Albugo candida]|uniref:PinX1-related protein 1 n=1 Tax=Albugo candida TaxID=65357 RepID=A0A024G4D8_9STRA|nr:unnamed protein product [Albugo candida]|eukprot:CCI41532.1 unnamed protein product [Albugo candida]
MDVTRSRQIAGTDAQSTNTSEMNKQKAVDNDGQVMIDIGGTQNMAWSSDTSKFGFKMLQKMGWIAGKGVGKHLQGNASHLKIKAKTNSTGVGCSLKQREEENWTETAQNFSKVLEILNQSQSTMKNKDKSKKKKKKKENKAIKRESKYKAPKRLLYSKRIRQKDAKNYSATDMAAILGMNAQ